MVKTAKSFDLCVNPLAGLGEEFPDPGALLPLCDAREIVVKRLAVCVKKPDCPVVEDTDGCTYRYLPRCSSWS
jgi:hypothetical protein